MERPRIRAVEAFPVEVEGEQAICVRDPLEVASGPLLVRYPAFFIMTLCNGSNSIGDIEAAFQRKYGQPLERSQLTQLLAQLDELYYLENQRFDKQWQKLLTDFKSARVRSPMQAGVSYPAEPEELRQNLESFFSDSKGPVTQPLPNSSPVKGIIAPHIDLRVGGPTYAWAYRALLEKTDADLFIILGTSHQPGTELFTATGKHFATPLGNVTTSLQFVRELHGEYGNAIFADEILHRTEHSVEFQILFLKHVFDNRRKFEVVPILVGSFHQILHAGLSPMNDTRVRTFVEGLAKTISASGRSACLVAGVDFAHIGKKFGDDQGLIPSLVRKSEKRDHELIEALEAIDSRRFFALAASDKDSTRVCGLSAMYTFVEVAKRLGVNKGQLLSYDRSEERQTQSSVSFASLAFW